MHQAYRKLHLHLERHPLGFPSTASGRDFDILKGLFTAEEAEVAVHLVPRLHTVGQISARAGLEPALLAPLLARMAEKGLVMEDKRKGEPRYCLIPFVPGIYEFQVKNLDERLAQAFEEIYPDLAREIAGSSTPWMRVLPAEQSMSSMEVVPYHRASHLVAQSPTVAVTDCICRKEKKLVGKGCSKPMDSICLYFTPWAEFAIDKGIAQKVSPAEATKVLKRAEDAALVHLAVNVLENPSAMCQCCSCCCGVMRTVTELKMPHGVARSSYHSVADAASCTGCEACVPVCPVGAISMVDEKAVVDGRQCIGCGVCVVECPAGSLGLVSRRPEEAASVPRNWAEMIQAIAAEKGRTYFFA